MTEAARQLWSLWQQDTPPDLKAFVAALGDLPPLDLARLACIDLRQRWGRGERKLAEDYLSAFPALAGHAEAALDVIHDEYRTRRHGGEMPDSQEYFDRFPHLADLLRQQFELFEALEAVTPATADGDSTRVDVFLSRGLAAAAESLPSVPGYELVGVLGQGGMGIVYRAWQTRPRRPVALKMIRPGAVSSAAFLGRFRTESETLGRLRHPNIVTVYEVGEHAGAPFLALELLEGGTLAGKVQGTLPDAREVAGLVRTLAQAVQHAHSAGVVHRDLKPDNVLFAADGTPKITDFGLARDLAEQQQTRTGDILGTPGYMAPEQAAGRARAVGPPADVYALGGILYFLLTGRPPFLGQSPTETLLLVLTEEPVPPRRLRPGIPMDLETICLKCLEKEPRQRYACAADLAADLERFLQDRPTVARPVGRWRRVGKFARRHKAVVSGLAVVFLTLLLGTAGTAVGLVRASRERDRAVLAEKQTRQLLADVRAQAAQLAVRRGAWDEALVHLDEALAAGPDNEGDLRCTRARVLLTTQRLGEARAELAALAQREDLSPPNRALVLLWRGETEWDRSTKPEALGLIRQALDTGDLPAADAAYARGMLARSVPEAVGHFRAAADEDPFHRRAQALLTTLLILQGRQEEARQRLDLVSKFFPHDPAFTFCRAALLALAGDKKSALALFDPPPPELSAGQVRTARSLVDAFDAVAGMNEVLDGKAGWLAQALIVKKMAGLALRLPRLRAGGDLADEDILMPLPPVLLEVGHGLAPLGSLPTLLSSLGGNLDGLAKRLGMKGVLPPVEAVQRLAEVHPDGFIYLLLGIMLLDRERFPEAERAFLGAARSPSMFHVRSHGLFGAAACQFIQGGPEGRQRFLDSTRQLVASGEVRPDWAPTLLHCLVSYAKAGQTGDLDLARYVLGEWERKQGASGESRRYREEMARLEKR